MFIDDVFATYLFRYHAGKPTLISAEYLISIHIIHDHRIPLYTTISNSFQAYNLLHYWYFVCQYSTETINAIRQTMTYI